MALDSSLMSQQAELERLGFQILQVEPNRIIASRRSFYWECFLTFINYTVFVQRVNELSVDRMMSDRFRISDTLHRPDALNPNIGMISAL